MAEVFAGSTAGGAVRYGGPVDHVGCDTVIAGLRARVEAVEAHLPAVLDALRVAAADAAYGCRAERFTAALDALGGSEGADGG